MKRKLSKSLLSVSASIVIAFCAACEGDINTPPIVENKKSGIQIFDDAKFGKVLTDKDGKTLYFFANDTKGISSCTDGCIATWPIYYSEESSTDLNLDKSQVGEIVRADNKKQSTYKGYPLYYFANDIAVKEIKGDGVGKIWYVAKPDYVMMIANAQLIGDDSKSYKSDFTEGEQKTTYLTDDLGNTLYAFASDKFDKNNYTKSDGSNNALWPIFEKESGPLPSLINPMDVNTISVFGKKQLTYKGWPLYYFQRDTNRGDNKGVSFPRPKVWPIVNDATNPAPTN